MKCSNCNVELDLSPWSISQYNNLCRKCWYIKYWEIEDKK